MFKNKMNQSQFFFESEHTSMLGDDYNNQVSKSIGLNNSNSESELLQIFEPEFSQNDSSDLQLQAELENQLLCK